MKPFTKLLIMIATLANVGCGSEGFTPHEKEVIAAGEVDIMALTTIANEQDSILLRSKSEPLTREMVESKEFELLCRRMLATVQDPLNEGVGIAAPQVGLLRRLVAVQRFDKEGEPFEFFVNPEIVELGDDAELGGEGCLSVPDIYAPVVRPARVVLDSDILDGFNSFVDAARYGTREQAKIQPYDIVYYKYADGGISTEDRPIIKINGGVFTGTRRLKMKESDRAAAMAQELAAFGTEVAVEENTVTVKPVAFHAPDRVLNGHNDHRIVMSLAVLLMQTGGEIAGAQAVRKSFPDFFEKLKLLGIEVQTNGTDK